jgi:hypothetical protein
MPKKPKNGISILDRWLTTLKISHNPVSVCMKTFSENLLHLPPPADHLNNLLNPNMNNIMSIDYTNKDLTHDSDMILPRWA